MDGTLPPMSHHRFGFHCFGTTSKIKEYYLRKEYFFPFEYVFWRRVILLIYEVFPSSLSRRSTSPLPSTTTTNAHPLKAIDSRRSFSFLFIEIFFRNLASQSGASDDISLKDAPDGIAHPWNPPNILFISWVQNYSDKLVRMYKMCSHLISSIEIDKRF